MSLGACCREGGICLMIEIERYVSSDQSLAIKLAIWLSKALIIQITDMVKW